MSETTTDQTLPLRYSTPDAWADGALSRPLELLNDHAHLEKKAASNALELLNRWPEPSPPENWVTAMTSVARDEAEHLGIVTRLLARRGGALTRHHRNPYAYELRQLVRRGEGVDELMDRLMVSALIEARSCERFEILARCCDDGELAKLYRGLFNSERGHYRVFIHLAEQIRPEPEVRQRWERLLDTEAEIIARQTPGPRMHSGPEAG